MNQEEQGKKIGQVVAKCWSDEGFKRKLLADPAATLKAGGLEVPSGRSIKAVEDTDKVIHFVIPARPAELSDDDLEKVAGGMISEKEYAVYTGSGSSPTLPWWWNWHACR